MRLELRQLVRYRRGLRPAIDAVAVASPASDEAATAARARFFLPGLLPCGECPACRRALMGACPSRRQVLAADSGAAALGDVVDVPDRFLTPLDEVAGPDGPLPDETAVLAGVVAAALSAMAAVAAAPGDEALWLGSDVIGPVGAELAAARGLRSRHVSSGEEAALPSAAPDPASPTLPPSGHGRSQPFAFVTTPDADTLKAAAAAATPGAVLVVFAEGPFVIPAGMTLPADGRLVLLGATHPDLVPEALAALARGEVSAARIRERLGGG